MADKKFLTQVAMPLLRISRLRIVWSERKRKWPDLWTDGDSQIVVTREWARQKYHERRKRLVHEMLHIKGLEHGSIHGLEYSTLPAQDTYSETVYRSML